LRHTYASQLVMKGVPLEVVQEQLPFGDGAYRYVYPMGGDRETAIEEFSFEADLGAAGREMRIAASEAARVEDGGTRVTMRRSGFVPRADLLLQMKPADRPPPLRVVRSEGDRDEADYVMVRYAPDVEWRGQTPRPAPVLLLIT
jgi:hypothetical protein